MSDSLDITDLTVRYGGAVAVDSVSLTASLGTVTGLIGPNGAGKTTLFNACSGLVRPSSGHVSLFGDDVTRLAPHLRARRGLGRTFQRMELLDSMSVLSNVSIGPEARLSGGNFIRHCVERPADRRLVAEAAEEALELCSLTALRHRPVGTLSTGQRRLVDLARVVAGGFRMLLLDEPSSGLDTTETEEFGRVIAALVQTRGCGILLVEHDMSLTLSICSYLYVLDFGKQVFAGTPDEVRESVTVRSAYLGEVAV